MNKIVKFFFVFIAIVILTQSFYVCAVNANNKNDKTRGSVDVSKYNISVKVDADKHKINGKVLMKITNNTNKAIKRICIRNYAASILGKKGKSIISNLKIDNKKTSIKKKKDKSVIYAVLKNRMLNPRAKCKLSIGFKTDIPQKDDRFGYHGKKGNQYINLSYCFPELAAYENGKWLEYPYIKDGESNYNRIKNYTIRVTAPKYLKVISVGNEKQTGTFTKIIAKNVRDMAIVLSDCLKTKSKTVKGVKINYFGNKSKYMKTFNRFQLATAADCFRIYTDKFGKYPYKELDVVSDYVHGMEFSGLVMCGIPDLNTYEDIEKKANYYKSSIVVAHEVAHQWFYNKVGNNPYTEPWLDEGFSDFCENYIYQFSNTKTLKKIRKEDERRGLYSLFEEMEYNQFCAIQKTEYENTNKKYKGKVNWAYRDFNRYSDYSQVVYRNGAYFLNCLKTEMGNKKFFNMMRDYCDAFAKKEVTTGGFIKKVLENDNSAGVKVIVKRFIN